MLTFLSQAERLPFSRRHSARSMRCFFGASVIRVQSGHSPNKTYENTDMTPSQTQGVPVIGPLLKTLFGTRNERFVKRYTTRVDAISNLEPEVRPLDDAALRAKTDEFRERIAAGEKASDLVIPAFAVAREIMDRNIGIRNIFNPDHAEQFPVDKLPAAIRELYDTTKAQMEKLEDAAPEGRFLGCAEPVPGWMQVDIPIEIYDAVRELFPDSKPPFRARPFDVQLIGGMVLYQGKIAEMKTGEGKTIVAPLACYLASLEGLEVHVVTVNDYLVQRDRDWVFPFYLGAGLTVGAIHPMHMQPEDIKRVMYGCDVVYGTTSEFGFDYLRDNMKKSASQQVQRAREFAIVDEVDSVLIDEARTPLIISGQAYEEMPRYDLARSLALHLVEKNKPWSSADEGVQECMKRIKGLEGDIRNARDKSSVPVMQQQMEEAKNKLPELEAQRDQFTQYYEVELDKRSAHLTHDGIEEAQRTAGIGSFYVGENVDMPHLMEQSIRAHVVYKRDRDYIISPQMNPQTGQNEPAVIIVDVNTGRPMVGRQWSDGLHQAVEAKEGVPIKPETQTVATITIQNFFKMYKRLAGMTGTADTEAQEFHDIYGLDVVSIPTNKPVIRADYNDVVYLTGKDKWSSIVDEIKGFNDVGQPVLVGTTSVESSETLSQMLTKRHGVKHEVLNAKQHEREAHIIENAGQLGAVMIATNMAGRGTDIKLAKLTREQVLEHWKRRELAPRELTTEATDEEARRLIYKKIAPRELGLNKRDVEQMSDDEIELGLLRKWAQDHTWADAKRIEKATADELRDWIDEQGRFLLHRIRWVSSVEELGGLHVVGTERHESRRIDNQLRGRSGRQGDQGSSRFFVSLDDDLMKMFAGETTMRILSRLGMKEGDSIEHPMLTKSVERAQRKVEERNFQIRKNILEYDEVMEHQRQRFYGLRQRSLEGRDVKHLIFDYIEESCDDSVERFLDRDYAIECVAEFAKEKLGVSIPFERLRGRDEEDIERRVRDVAKEEAGHMAALTLGEYMPAESPPEDYDLIGLSNWAKAEFDADLKPSEIREMSRRQVELSLSAAAEEKIDKAELDGVDHFMRKQFAVAELIKWAKEKFGVEINPEEIEKAETNEDVAAFLSERAQDRYVEREVEYPVTFMLELTKAAMAQSPQQASAQLANWANRRYDLGWDENVLRTKMPNQVHQELLAASRKFLDEQTLEKALDEALALKDDDDALQAHFREKYNLELNPLQLRTHGEERENLVRSAVEGTLRAEMVQFERMVLLDVLDQAWKDHLRAMDQLRDAIGFRAFSQQDPRIAFKKEGAQNFEEMEKVIRDRVTEFVFKLRLQPQIGPPPGQQRQHRPPAQRAPVAAGGFGSMISGPGFSNTPTTPPKKEQGGEDED